MMDSSKLYQYTGEARDGIETGAMVAYVADSPNVGLVHVRDTVSQKTATLPRKDLKETKLFNNDMDAVGELTSIMDGLKNAMENVRPVSITYIDEAGEAVTAVYSTTDEGRVSLVNKHLYDAYQLVKHLSATSQVPGVADTASVAAPSILVTGHLIQSILTALSGGDVIH